MVSGISQLKNCGRSCSRMERSGLLTYYVTVLKPLEGLDLKLFCQLVVAEAQQGVRGEKLTMCAIPVNAITSSHSHSLYSPGKSGAKHTAFGHCIFSALKSTFMTKRLAGHFQNAHIIFIVSNLLDDDL